MQSKVLCLLSVAVFASSVAAANLPKNDNGENVTNQIQVETVVIPSIPNIVSLPDLQPAILEARSLVQNYLGTQQQNFADSIQSLVVSALKTEEPCVDMINVMSQVLDAYNRVAAATPVQVGLLLLNEGLALSQNMLKVVINVMLANVVTFLDN